MYKWRSTGNRSQRRTLRQRLEAWAVAATFLALIAVTVAQALPLGD